MSWERPDAWRDTYDHWKTTDPADYAYDDDPPEDDREGRPFVYQPRHRRKRDAELRAQFSRPTRVAIELGHARYALKCVHRGSRNHYGLKLLAREHIDRARKIRTTIGPVIDSILVELPF